MVMDALIKKQLSGSIVSGSELFLEDIQKLLDMESNTIYQYKNSNTYQLHVPRIILQKLNDNYSDSMKRKRIPSTTIK